MYEKVFKKYLDNVEELLHTYNDVEWQEAKAFEIQIAIDEFCWSLDLDGKGYEKKYEHKEIKNF